MPINVPLYTPRLPFQAGGHIIKIDESGSPIGALANIFSAGVKGYQQGQQQRLTQDIAKAKETRRQKEFETTQAIKQRTLESMQTPEEAKAERDLKTRLDKIHTDTADRALANLPSPDEAKSTRDIEQQEAKLRLLKEKAETENWDQVLQARLDAALAGIETAKARTAAETARRTYWEKRPQGGSTSTTKPEDVSKLTTAIATTKALMDRETDPNRKNQYGLVLGNLIDRLSGPKPDVPISQGSIDAVLNEAMNPGSKWIPTPRPMGPRVGLGVPSASQFGSGSQAIPPTVQPQSVGPLAPTTPPVTGQLLDLEQTSNEAQKAYQAISMGADPIKVVGRIKSSMPAQKAAAVLKAMAGYLQKDKLGPMGQKAWENAWSNPGPLDLGYGG